ncbi:hypothetical protein PG985_005279 [Apiospora marii]|uniref:Uncharacterized protein n=1 Tax=Apiospora marii TaxID=335849 RepID=A0ABR1SD32_9PEZI
MADLTDIQQKLLETQGEIKELDTQRAQEEAKLQGFREASAKYHNDPAIAAAMQCETNGAWERITKIQARRDELMEEEELFRFHISIQSSQTQGTEGADNDQSVAANGSQGNRKRPAPADSIQATAKRFRAYRGNSRIEIDEILYESLPSDEIRAEVRAIMNRNDEAAYYARQVDRAKLLRPFFKDGTIAMDRNITVNDSCELRGMNVDRELFLSDECRSRTAVQKDKKTVLDNVVALLSNRDVKSVSHVPLQMRAIDAADPEKALHHARLDFLLQCVRKLQMDSAVIGQQTLDIAHMVQPANGTRQLVEALNTTYDMHGMNDVYKVAQGGGEEILRAAGSLDHAGRTRMMGRLLRSSLVLAKYTCLATCLTHVVAWKFGRMVSAFEPVKLSSLRECMRHYRALRVVWGDYCYDNRPVDMEDCGLHYNPDDAIRGKIGDKLVTDKLGELSYVEGMDVYFYMFLSSTDFKD